MGLSTVPNQSIVDGKATSKADTVDSPGFGPQYPEDSDGPTPRVAVSAGSADSHPTAAGGVLVFQPFRPQQRFAAAPSWPDGGLGR
ncbi:hypothetical protein [Natronoglycomyces albus]|uniref:Uncharacterized protein n=1 Tax=Natronoglycomyces albus TaxID=2811108 RepID=A0A895XN67_9ACTN|nr:hypothetical protein [Natronoglycomyces albus]QSB06567.1 hypothetical protein JQS30_06605 [Natronoglycomyces albus]